MEEQDKEKKNENLKYLQSAVEKAFIPYFRVVFLVSFICCIIIVFGGSSLTLEEEYKGIIVFVGWLFSVALIPLAEKYKFILFLLPFYYTCLFIYELMCIF